MQLSTSNKHIQVLIVYRLVHSTQTSTSVAALDGNAQSLQQKFRCSPLSHLSCYSPTEFKHNVKVMCLLAERTQSFYCDRDELVHRRQASALGSFFSSASLATISDWLTALSRWLGANATHLPFDYGSNDKPLSLLSSCWASDFGSSLNGISADMRARNLIRSLTAL